MFKYLFLILVLAKAAIFIFDGDKFTDADGIVLAIYAVGYAILDKLDEKKP